MARALNGLLRYKIRNKLWESYEHQRIRRNSLSIQKLKRKVKLNKKYK
jgi:hypothetical protein